MLLLLQLRMLLLGLCTLLFLLLPELQLCLGFCQYLPITLYKLRVPALESVWVV